MSKPDPPSEPDPPDGQEFSNQDHDHLSRISTMWSALEGAHGAESGPARAAQHRMMDRYSAAIYRYLRKLLPDRDAADDVFQQFALNFMRGGFRHADPAKGRFRDYLKVSMRRLVTDYHRARSRQPLEMQYDPAADGEDPLADMDRDFTQSCRDELLSRAWEALKQIELHASTPLYTILRYRAAHPDVASAQMAASVSKSIGLATPLTAPGARKILQRARETFADLLLCEVMQMACEVDREAIEAEVNDLGLLPYCRAAINRRFDK